MNLMGSCEINCYLYCCKGDLDATARQISFVAEDTKLMRILDTIIIYPAFLKELQHKLGAAGNKSRSQS